MIYIKHINIMLVILLYSNVLNILSIKNSINTIQMLFIYVPYINALIYKQYIGIHTDNTIKYI